MRSGFITTGNTAESTWKRSTVLECLSPTSISGKDFRLRHSELLFDCRRNRAVLDFAETNSKKTVQTAFHEVSDALSAHHWLGEQVRNLLATHAAQAAGARLVSLRYQ